tara:strand:- start:446 stop:559 length:114 start_codon:yes stop_codon:yes gene_type:complete
MRRSEEIYAFQWVQPYQRKCALFGKMVVFGGIAVEAV